MTFIDDHNGCWEGFQCFRIRKFGYQCIWINVKFFLFHSGTKIQIKASLKSLLNEVFIKGNFPHLIKSIWNKVEGSIFFI